MTTDLARTNEEPRDLTLAIHEDAAGALAHVLGTGDLYQLTNEQRVAHYLNLCTSLGLNPLSRPFQWIEFKEGENSPAVLTLYFKPAGAAQMLRNHHVSVHYPRKEIVGELFVCEAHGQAPDGRKGSATKYVSLTNKYGKLTGNRLANAFMSAESGALRRLALNMFGLSIGPDPKETTSIRPVYLDGIGRVLTAPTDEQRYLAENPGAARAIGEVTFEDLDLDGVMDASDMPDQRPRPEELERPKREGPRPTFKAGDEDVKRWLGAWFGSVKGLSLDTDEARARFVTDYTREWPEGKRTDSLKTMFARMTADEAGEFLAHVRALMDDERAELLRQAREDAAPATSTRPRDRVADSVALTGGPDEPAF